MRVICGRAVWGGPQRSPLAGDAESPAGNRVLDLVEVEVANQFVRQLAEATLTPRSRRSQSSDING